MVMMQDAGGTNERSGEYSFFVNEKTPAPFNVGLVINLQMADQKHKVNRFPVYLAGWITPHLLLTYHMHFDTGIMAIPTGTQMIARYLYEGQIYGFFTKLHSKQTEPLNLWFLEYPSRIEVKNLRQSSRIPITVEINTTAGEVYFTHDISIHGASLLVSQDSPGAEKKIGDTMQLNFALPDSTRIEKLNASVVRIYTEKNHQMLGVKFDKTSMQLALISAYLEKVEKNFIDL
jgi:c-di-GMP-binding flagellar brake protein YcgR